MTAYSDHDKGGSTGGSAEGARQDDPARPADAGRADHDELRRTFARRIDCAVHEGRGAAPRGGRRQPARGRGGSGTDGGHAA